MAIKKFHEKIMKKVIVNIDPSDMYMVRYIFNYCTCMGKDPFCLLSDR